MSKYYNDDERICIQCNKTFWCEKWEKQKFCSPQCATDARKGITYEEKRCPQCEKIFKREFWRHQKFCSVECGIDYHRGEPREKRIKCSNKAKKHRPERKIKDGRRMALHRYLMEQKLGRQLKSSETVHHKDMDKHNNNPDCSNYYLYLNESEHQKGHRSLEGLVKDLLRDRIINFKNGKYHRA